MTDIVLNASQFTAIILLILSLELLNIGLNSNKKSGGFCVIFAGISFIGLAITSYEYINVIGGVFVLFAVYFIMTGINKAFFKKKGENPDTKDG